ncbi:sn-glycerol-3-phosphate ABC transporter ATP-binding protein UgpC [Oscillatoria sp. FACHB-1407]|uniref:ABC transporter ATP-binding protein n=1 Tax=Oscillatoria sp. FACHB-1407 TaxID=2692847 RepID=UPI00168A102F|nr:sn-glycerol-3-phosphate ABC transporter ATP-binding protein UgpC [Oscillatoria sp. FACHB-1407]MBD2464036.1 sn-glycerol-3-phosphate ABC transporter ATP-binding protein UgpC [Oscillatoria sp. FACHB-1407]
MARVCLEDITRRFAGVTAIDQITFEVPDGQFWVLVGPSGCGKSTILRTIAGLETATSGKLYIGDRLVNQVPARQRDVAMVFQNYALYPHMTVAENLAFGLKMRGGDTKTARSRIESVARSLDIAHLLDRKPRQLSGGQQQRVALGRAIAREPQVFLLDEPLSNLDAQLRDDTRAELKQLHQRLGITTIYVTHDQVEAMTLADQIVVLNRGRIQQIGDPQTIYAQPTNQMVATFLGSPPMNILPATYDGVQFQLMDGQTIPCPEGFQHVLRSAQGQRFNLGIRPEHLHVVPEPAHLMVVATVVEPLGREILIRTALPDQDPMQSPVINIQVEPTLRPAVGERLSIQLALDHLFVFDPTTGDRIMEPL